MGKLKDITGHTFGRLTPLYKLHNHYGQGAYWLCMCECGNLTEVRGTMLRNGNTKSCGCLNHEPTTTKHNKCNTKLYRVYYGIKQRCYNKKYHQYQDYGGRGVKICDEWLNDFETFYNWAMNNNYREGLTIDRIDVNGDYEPDNCRWSDRKTQAQNRRNNIYLTYEGKTQTMKQWAEELGINYNTIKSRHYKSCDTKYILFGDN